MSSRILSALALILAATTALAQEVSNEVKHDTSEPLRTSMRGPLEPETGRRQVRPIELVPTRIGGRAPIQADPIEQTTPGSGTAPAKFADFEGLGKGLPGFDVRSVPPDTTGAAGETQFVQAVNTSFAVFDKSGSLILGPFPLKRLWSGFGTACETQNDGDPIIRFDSLARRWVITQFQVKVGFSQCVAISTTPDATGSYHRYEFKYPAMNDYPKLGVWPDAYYITFNMFRGLSGARACAYERDKMLVGAAARQVCFQLSAQFFSLMPGDVDGRTPPDSGTPNPMLSLGGDSRSLDLWRFHVDWSNPMLSTFGLGGSHTPNLSIAVAPFSDACGGGTCIPQQGTSDKLDSLGERLMMRAAYRRFADHDALVITHNVTSTSAPAAVRWYEIRGITGGAPSVAQQGTFSPDTSSRWMGSAAMDAGGNLLAGYSISSKNMHPSIRVAGRTPTDPSGKLGPEVTVINGTGKQTGASRWGDYSEMSIDPTDDCTFWYTTEFMARDGTFAWSTRIASFRFPICNTRAADPRRVVFVSSRDGNREIYSISADGSDLQRLTNNPASDFAPSVSPDGKEIVFVSDRDGSPNLYIMGIDGSNVRRLTTVPATDDQPVWVVPTPSAEPAAPSDRSAPPPDENANVFGGNNVMLRSTPTGASIDFGCATGQLNAPLPASGPFDIPGTFTRRNPGPIRADEAQPAPQPARFTGSVNDGVVTLTVRVGGNVVAEANLTQGRVTRVVRCVSPG